MDNVTYNDVVYPFPLDNRLTLINDSADDYQYVSTRGGGLNESAEFKQIDGPASLYFKNPTMVSSITSAPANTITFNGGGKAFLTFHADGRVTADPDMDPDEAAKIILDCVSRLWMQAYG